MAFGLTSTPMYKWLKFGRRVLLCAIQKHPLVRLAKITEDEIRTYQEAISRKYPILEDVWGACDGLKLPIQASGNWLIQNQYYNGWKAGHYINSVFVFAPDGRIRLCSLNAPGAWHDSTIADYGIYDKLAALYDLFKAKIVVDSAFKLATKPYLIRSDQIDPTNVHGVALNRAATSVRQLSEHGMRMIQAQFPRLTDPFRYEEHGERKVIMQLMVFLYNFQASRVGINEILNSYMGKKDGYYDGHDITPDANNVFDTL